MPILSSRRQVTLPKELCERLQVLSGDPLDILEYDGRITILKRAKGRSAGVLEHLKADPRFSDVESLQDALGSKHTKAETRRRAA